MMADILYQIEHLKKYYITKRDFLGNPLKTVKGVDDVSFTMYKGEILGVVGIVLASRNRKAYNTKAALVCSIIGLILAVGNHILGILMAMSMLA